MKASVLHRTDSPTITKKEPKGRVSPRDVPSVTAEKPAWLKEGQRIKTVAEFKSGRAIGTEGEIRCWNDKLVRIFWEDTQKDALMGMVSLYKIVPVEEVTINFGTFSPRKVDAQKETKVVAEKKVKKEEKQVEEEKVEEKAVEAVEAKPVEEEKIEETTHGIAVEDLVKPAVAPQEPPKVISAPRTPSNGSPKSTPKVSSKKEFKRAIFMLDCMITKFGSWKNGMRNLNSGLTGSDIPKDMPLRDVSFDRWEELAVDMRQAREMLSSKAAGTDMCDLWNMANLERAISMSFRLEEFIRKVIKVNQLNSAKNSPKEQGKYKSKESACLRELYMVLLAL